VIKSSTSIFNNVTILMHGFSRLNGRRNSFLSHFLPACRAQFRRRCRPVAKRHFRILASGLGIETRDSAQYRYVHGQLQRTKKPQQIRGLNRNHNHEMKEIFKGAATRASCGVGPLRDFYVALVAKGMKPEMARLRLARKIAAMALTLWKKEEHFDAEQLKPQAA
jgi:hypothetical protein